MIDKDLLTIGLDFDVEPLDFDVEPLDFEVDFSPFEVDFSPELLDSEPPDAASIGDRLPPSSRMHAQRRLSLPQPREGTDDEAVALRALPRRSLFAVNDKSARREHISRARRRPAR